MAGLKRLVIRYAVSRIRVRHERKAGVKKNHMKRFIRIALALLMNGGVTAGTAQNQSDGDKNQSGDRFLLDARKAAMVVIDMQNFSCAPSKGEALPHIHEVIKQINKLVDFCHKIQVPVIWVRQNFTTDNAGTDTGLYPVFHDPEHLKEMANKGKGTELFSEMHFNPSTDHVVFKNRYSAFLSNPPELREKIDSLKKTQLIVAGVAANVCVESTIRDAMQLNYEVVLVSDGVTATNDTLLKSTLMNTKLFFGDVRTSEEIMESLKK